MATKCEVDHASCLAIDFRAMKYLFFQANTNRGASIRSRLLADTVSPSGRGRLVGLA